MVLLTKSVSKFTSKKFYEIDAWSLSSEWSLVKGMLTQLTILKYLLKSFIAAVSGQDWANSLDCVEYSISGFNWI